MVILCLTVIKRVSDIAVKIVDGSGTIIQMQGNKIDFRYPGRGVR